MTLKGPLVVWYISNVTGFAAYRRRHPWQGFNSRDQTFRCWCFENKRVKEYQKKKQGLAYRADDHTGSLRRSSPAALEHGPLVGLSQTLNHQRALSTEAAVWSLCMSLSVTTEHVHITEVHYKCIGQGFEPLPFYPDHHKVPPSHIKETRKNKKGNTGLRLVTCWATSLHSQPSRTYYWHHIHGV